jgi:hypothetical protein
VQSDVPAEQAASAASAASEEAGEASAATGGELTSAQLFLKKMLLSQRLGAAPRDLPVRDFVVAEPVGETDRWLVTLSCGHKKYTDQKLFRYLCRECAL